MIKSLVLSRIFAIAKDFELNVNILNDTINNPIICSQDPLLSTFKLTKCFNSLQTDFLRGIQGEIKMLKKRTEFYEGKEERNQGENERVNGWTHQNGQTHTKMIDDRFIHRDK